ncbi:hypothetical protein [Piscinibacter sp.]|uniref:hypothetical protein n=1 Tax=Piscinibacter sp. TaxID=1903157 RepID=UPI002C698531|nr:hypothetical protein [Albitalea sp.]HUG21355.1 hypothetical protein [Albitalea sp.]
MTKPDPLKNNDRRAKRPAGAGWLRPLRWIKRFFARDLKLVRQGAHIRVGWVETVCREADVPARAAPVEPPSGMQAELRALMSRHADTRLLMRHLAFVERALQLSGPEALPGLPQEVLQKGLAQLESLVRDWSSAGLAELRVRLADALDLQRGCDASFAPTNSKLSDFHLPQRVQVSDATPSAFEELEQIWAAHRPDVAPGGKQTPS